jgi:hypothetical protein
MPNPIVHVEIVGSDPGALIEFYSEAFSWDIKREMPHGFAHLVTDSDNRVNGGIGPAVGDEQSVRFYIEVPCLEAALERLTRLGATTVDEPQRVPRGPRVARFLDPEGNLVGLVADRPSINQRKRDTRADPIFGPRLL